MLRFIVASVVLAVVGGLIAAPVPLEPDAKSLVAGLSDPDEKVRNEASAALKGRADALPWLRRASRSRAPITAARAATLLEPHEAKRQDVVAKVIDACTRGGHIDLFIEWHHFWQPAKKEDLWPVGLRAAKAGLDLYAKRVPPKKPNELGDRIALGTTAKQQYHDSGDFDLTRVGGDFWRVRADRLNADLSGVTFASILGPARLGSVGGGQFLALGPIDANSVWHSAVICDGDIGNGSTPLGNPLGVRLYSCVVVCRGTIRLHEANDVVILTGAVEFDRSAGVWNCLIRTASEVRLPERVEPVKSKIETNVKDATAPYKFFELTDVGLSLADDEEGLVVTSVKADTPFGNCGLAKGDLIRAIDDVPAGHSEEFRKAVRRALVRQGDCLITITRGDKNHDLPVFFPLPK